MRLKNNREIIDEERPEETGRIGANGLGVCW